MKLALERTLSSRWSFYLHIKYFILEESHSLGLVDVAKSSAISVQCRLHVTHLLNAFFNATVLVSQAAWPSSAYMSPPTHIHTDYRHWNTHTHWLWVLESSPFEVAFAFTVELDYRGRHECAVYVVGSDILPLTWMYVVLQHAQWVDYGRVALF